jgi:cell division septation protein DedD
MQFRKSFFFFCPLTGLPCERGRPSLTRSVFHSAGKDAARAFVTGCFTDHLTHDIRGLSEKEMKSLEHWKQFFANHKDYPKVGRVVHDPIDPDSPLPGPCSPPPPPPAHPQHKDPAADPQPEATPQVAPAAGKETGTKHTEL